LLLAQPEARVHRLDHVSHPEAIMITT
jgi:hypothetical protein